jgi:hypothetical protein
MSKLIQKNGDDHPEAARKHLLDAQTLLQARRSDGAAYLSGYVVECALKSIWLLETRPTGESSPPWGKRGHDLGFLESSVASLATIAEAKTARYFGPTCSSIKSSPIITWNPEQRYRPEGIIPTVAEAYHKTAQDVYTETIAEMILNGDA